MKIVVLVKDVPDTYGTRLLVPETGLSDRSGERVLDEIGERALEVALGYLDSHADAEVVALTMGPATVSESLRKALAIGASAAVQVTDDGLIGADTTLTAETLAAVLDRIGFDLVIAGNVSTDGSGGVVPAMIAELLDVPHATNLTEVGIEGAQVTGTRVTDGGTMGVAAALPAVISVTERLPAARFPNFKRIMAAKKKEILTFSLADLGIDPADPAAARSIVLAVAQTPPHPAGVKITDEGDGGEKLADFLVQNRLA